MQRAGNIKEKARAGIEGAQVAIDKASAAHEAEMSKQQVRGSSCSSAEMSKCVVKFPDHTLHTALQAARVTVSQAPPYHRRLSAVRSGVTGSATHSPREAAR